ncbi:MAG: tetratricopeptide repeat protein [bacterium]
MDRQGNLQPRLLYVLGTSYHAMGKLAEAADAFERLVKEYPDQATQQLIQGLRADAHGDREKASSAYRAFLSAVKSDPNRPYVEQKLTQWDAQTPANPPDPNP